MFDIGFELEFETDLGLREVKEELRSYLGNYPWVKKLQVVPDGSVDDGWEIITPPWKAEVAMQRLRKLFAFIQEFGWTSRHTGLHINVSFSNSRVQAKSDYYSLVKAFPEDDILATFGRSRNEYCYSTKKTEFWVNSETVVESIACALVDLEGEFTLKQLERMVGTKKFQKSIVGAVQNAVADNFNEYMDEKYVGVNNKGNYFEFRVVGNKNYEYRYRDVADVVRKIKSAMKKSLKTAVK